MLKKIKTSLLETACEERGDENGAPLKTSVIFCRASRSKRSRKRF